MLQNSSSDKKTKALFDAISVYFDWLKVTENIWWPTGMMTGKRPQ